MGTEYKIYANKIESKVISVYEMSSKFTLHVDASLDVGNISLTLAKDLSPEDLRKMAEELVKAASYADGEPAEIKRLY